MGGGDPDAIQCLALIISTILLFISLYKVLTSVFELSSPFFTALLILGLVLKPFGHTGSVLNEYNRQSACTLLLKGKVRTYL